MNNKNLPSLIIHTDGGARGNPGPAATGFTIHNQAGKLLFQLGTTIGSTTNNVAEYTAVIHALSWVDNNHLLLSGFGSIQAFLDSSLVVNQLAGKFKIRQQHLIPLYRQTHALIAKIGVPVHFSYIPRLQNSAADKLVNLALDQSFR